MTNSKYTPGPWIVRPDLSIETGQSGITVAGLVDMPADARLIAAAPAMYALLKRAAISLQEYCAEINGDMNDSLACEIEATIAQAEGVSHE